MASKHLTSSSLPAYHHPSQPSLSPRNPSTNHKNTPAIQPNTAADTVIPRTPTPMQAFTAPIPPPQPLQNRRISTRRPPLARLPSTDVSHKPPNPQQDGPFALAAIDLFRRTMRPSIGWQSPRPGYAGFVEECRMLMARVGPVEQQRVVRRTLDTLFVAPAGPSTFRRWFADPWLNSRITPLFFEWLVGPCENNLPPEGGFGVKIEKCRFLDESGCKGLCVNMCQQPTQSYFTDVLGLPVRMTPDYEDKSCQMTFGVSPLPVAEDPALSGDCFIDCKMSSTVKQRDVTCYVNGGPVRGKKDAVGRRQGTS